MRLIIDVRDDAVSMADALQYCLEVVSRGRVSGRQESPQYCYHTSFKDGVQVSAFQNKESDRLVVFKEIK